MPGPIDAPTLELGIDDLVDWLELSAIFSPFYVSRTDALLGSLLQQQNMVEVDTSDIGEVDSSKERLIEEIENEIELRRSSIGDARSGSVHLNSSARLLSGASAGFMPLREATG